MPIVERITSFQNPKVKLAKQLHEKKHRQREMCFLVDDLRDLSRAISFGYEIAFVLACPSLMGDDEWDFVQSTPFSVYEVSPDLLEKTAYRQNPTGILAIVQQKPTPTLPIALSTPILGLVALEKPGNIGALLRTADASGFKTVFLIDTALDLYNPNIIRASTGACFLNNVYALSSEQALRFFKDNAYQVISAHLEGTKSLYDVLFTPKTAVMLGTEDEGLSATWEKACDELVKIPMLGQLSDSLNVSVSGAVFMFEAFRQLSNPS